MRYILAAAVGAVILVIPGILAFATWEDADEKPPLFDLYCDVDYWQGSAQCPSEKTALAAGLGAVLGWIVAVMRRSDGPDDAPRQEGQGSEPDPPDRPRQSPSKSSGDWTDTQRRRPH